MEQQEVRKNLCLENMDNLRNNANKVIIYKFMKKGFVSLTGEELAATTVNKYFESDFKLISGEDWAAHYKIEALEKLKKCKN
jgi:hypothetical protein